MKQRKNLDIEWKHLDVAGRTCDRCSGTIEAVARVLDELQEEGALEGIAVKIRETPLDEERIEESNEVLIDGVPIESILPVRVGTSSCPSCASLTGQESTCCRTVEYEGETHEQVPEELIRAAILKVLRGD
jgi:hypothetical protein